MPEPTDSSTPAVSRSSLLKDLIDREKRGRGSYTHVSPALSPPPPLGKTPTPVPRGSPLPFYVPLSYPAVSVPTWAARSSYMAGVLGGALYHGAKGLGSRILSAAPTVANITAGGIAKANKYFLNNKPLVQLSSHTTRAGKTVDTIKFNDTLQRRIITSAVIHTAFKGAQAAFNYESIYQSQYNEQPSVDSLFGLNMYYNNR